MKKTKVAILGTLAMTLGTSYIAYADTTETKEFVIYHTNDTHSRVDAFPYVTTLVEESKANGENVLYFDAGDTLHGQPIATTVKGESIVNILNVTGINAMTPGNHDFNYGLDRLVELADQLNFPIVASNVYYKGTEEHIFADYHVFEVDGVKVGVFGLATPETYTKTNPNNIVNVEFADPATEAERVTNILKNEEGCDVVISIAHLGVDESTELELQSTYVAEMVDGIDIMIDGHSHTEFSEGTVAGDTLIVSTGEYGNNIGRLTFDVIEGEVTNLSAELLDVVDADGNEVTTPSEEVLKVIAEEKEAVELVNGEVIGSTPYYLEGAREVVRTQESNLANVITAAMIDATGADVAITNGGGIRASIEAGDITKGDVVTVLPFGNFLVTETVTGQDIKDALELGYSSAGEAAGFFAQVGGINVVVDTTAEVGSRVALAYFDNGDALELDKEYTLATNDFLVAGGDGYTMLAGKVNYQEYSALDEIVIDYINSGDAVILEEPQGRIKFVEGYVAPSIDLPLVTEPITTLPAEKVELYNSAESEVKPVIEDGRSYLPVRALVQDVLGGTVVYDYDTAMVTATVNGETLVYDATQTAVFEGSTYLPIRSFSEELGFEVLYVAADKSVHIYSY